MGWFAQTMCLDMWELLELTGIDEFTLHLMYYGTSGTFSQYIYILMG
jgi:hypothetical protein